MKLIELRIRKVFDGYVVDRVYEGVGNVTYGTDRYLKYAEAVSWCRTVCPGVPVLRSW